MRSIICNLVETHLSSTGTVAEIGVDAGLTSRVLLERFPGLHVVMVDNWLARWSHRGRKRIWRTQEWMDGRKQLAVQNTQFAEDRRTILAVDSLVAADFVAVESVDLVFIDATHTPQALERDINAWHAKVKVNGLLVCHDIGGAIDRYYRRGLTAVVRSFVKQHPYRSITFDKQNLWWAIKECECQSES